MLSVTLRLLSMVALGAAQTSTLSVWVPPLDPGLKIPPDPKELVVSMVGSDASLATYVLDCASKTNKASSSDDKTASLGGVDANPTDLVQDRGLTATSTCGVFPVPYTIVQGPSTMMWNYAATGPNPPLAIKTPSVTPHSGDCLFSGSTEAVCAATDGTQAPLEHTYHEVDIQWTPFTVDAGLVTATSPSISASMTGDAKKKDNSTVSQLGIDSGIGFTAGHLSARTKAMSGSTELYAVSTGSISGISLVKISASTSAPPKSTNIGVQGSSSRRDGVFGALVIALAGAIL